MRYVVLTPTRNDGYRVIDTQASHPHRAVMAEPADKARADCICTALNAQAKQETNAQV